MKFCRRTRLFSQTTYLCPRSAAVKSTGPEVVFFAEERGQLGICRIPKELQVGDYHAPVCAIHVLSSLALLKLGRRWDHLVLFRFRRTFPPSSPTSNWPCRYLAIFSSVSICSPSKRRIIYLHSPWVLLVLRKYKRHGILVVNAGVRDLGSGVIPMRARDVDKRRLAPFSLHRSLHPCPFVREGISSLSWPYS